MSPHNQIAAARDGSQESEATSGELELNVIVREVTEDEVRYYIADCIELPGCVSEGKTEEEAKVNIEDAMRSCLSVVFEDSMKRILANRRLPDLRHVVSQTRMHINPVAELEFCPA